MSYGVKFTHLPLETSRSQLFEKFGEEEVVSLYLAPDKSHGYVYYSSIEDVEWALNTHILIGNMRLSVERAADRPSRSSPGPKVLKARSVLVPSLFHQQSISIQEPAISRPSGHTFASVLMSSTPKISPISDPCPKRSKRAKQDEWPALKRSNSKPESPIPKSPVSVSPVDTQSADFQTSSELKEETSATPTVESFGFKGTPVLESPRKRFLKTKSFFIPEECITLVKKQKEEIQSVCGVFDLAVVKDIDLKRNKIEVKYFDEQCFKAFQHWMLSISKSLTLPCLHPTFFKAAAKRRKMSINFFSKNGDNFLQGNLEDINSLWFSFKKRTQPKGTMGSSLTKI